jgi:branched-chain amino acid transport system substrate-binding protein
MSSTTRAIRSTTRGISKLHLSRYIAGAGTLALTVGLAACGSSSGGSGGSAKAPLTIGLLTSETGPYAETVGGSVQGAQAYAKYVNSHGGIGGRTLKIKAYDNAGSTTQELANAHAAVAEGDTAVAVNSYSLSAAEPYLRTSKLPVVGSDVDPGFSGSNFFSIFGDTFSVSPVQAVESTYIANTLHTTKVAYVSNNVAGLVQAMRAYVAVGQHYFHESPVYTNYNIDVTNNASLLPVAEAIKKSGARAVLAYLHENQGPTLQVDLNNIGAKVTVVCTGDGDPTIPQQYGSAVNGYTYASIVAPVTATDDPGIHQYIQAMGADSKFLSSGESGYAAVAMIGEAMQKVAKAGKAVTSANVTAQLNSLEGDTVGGILAPLSYPKDHTQFSNCYAYVQVQDGKWTRTSGSPSNPFVCKSVPKV